MTTIKRRLNEATKSSAPSSLDVLIPRRSLQAEGYPVCLGVVYWEA